MTISAFGKANLLSFWRRDSDSDLIIRKIHPEEWSGSIFAPTTFCVAINADNSDLFSRITESVISPPGHSGVRYGVVARNNGGRSGEESPARRRGDIGVGL
jgi:hypothetical protein